MFSSFFLQGNVSSCISCVRRVHFGQELHEGLRSYVVLENMHTQG